MFLVVFDSFWQFLAVFGSLWQFLAAFGSFWQFLAVFGSRIRNIQAMAVFEYPLTWVGSF
jgi:hypothetical protein